MSAPRTCLAISSLLACLLVPAAPAIADEAAAASSCVACHTNADMFDADAIARVAAHQGDVHAQAGISCHDCHGGNPDPSLAEDPGAMDTGFKKGAFHPAPARKDIPTFCGRCHSDIAYMRRFRPDARVDQEREYWTSQHGKLLRAGDTKVATCIDCHGSHGIRQPSDPASAVHPRKVAETCSACHADAEHMKGYELPDGSPLPVDQYARWRESVHAAALIEREDLSAPTCNDCHGNHGATPPGLASIGFVCGQCHGREAEKFRASPKHAGFQAHNELLADAGPEGCAGCHEEPQASVKIRTLNECASCHGNHAILRPSVTMLSPLPKVPCAFCHEAAEGAVIEVEEVESVRKEYETTRDALLAKAKSEGIADDELFDWMLDQGQALSPHLRGGEGERSPEFVRLLAKFRIGRTHFRYRDPATNQDVRAPILRCDTCHAAEGPDGEPSVGRRTAGIMLEKVRELAVRTARAERILLAARRGGVETGDATLLVDKAVDAQIQMQVLLHTFDAEPDGPYLTEHAKGQEQARLALASGQAALDELSHRHRGLVVALVFILLVLVALAVKIRQLSP